MTRLRKASGWALAELMVSMAVGLVVSLFASTLMVASNASYVAQDDIAAVEDAGRFALDALGRAVRQASYVDWGEFVEEADTRPAPVSGLDASWLSGGTQGLADPRDDAVNNSDVLALRFAGAPDDSVVNCAGFPVNEDARGWSIFYVAVGTDGVAELRCKYRGATAWKAEAVVRGVDALQVLYGIDTDTPADGRPNSYERAAAIDARDAALVLAGADEEARARDLNRKTHWKRVCAVRVSLLLHGARYATQLGSQEPFHLFGPGYDADADPGALIEPDKLHESLRHRERRVFAATFLLRNRPA
ncbi:MAG TPA: PilW family protein [Telluria sp.]|nr:PilW family protein [Telluria sp.]